MRYLMKNPGGFFETINDEIGSILKRNFDSVFPEYLFDKETHGMAMPVDIKEFDNMYDLKVELPGVKKEHINVELNKNFVKITAQKEDAKEEKGKKYHKTEFKYGKFSRTVYLPSEINTDKSNAELKDGILEIKLEKLRLPHEEVKKLEVK